MTSQEFTFPWSRSTLQGKVEDDPFFKMDPWAQSQSGRDEDPLLKMDPWAQSGGSNKTSDSWSQAGVSSLSWFQMDLDHADGKFNVMVTILCYHAFCEFRRREGEEERWRGRGERERERETRQNQARSNGKANGKASNGKAEHYPREEKSWTQDGAHGLF